MWALLGFMSFLGSIGCLVGAIIELIRKRGLHKRYFILSGSLFVLFIVAIIGTPKTPATENPSESVFVSSSTPATGGIVKTEAKVSEEDQKKAIQDAVLEFEKSAYALEESIKPVMDRYTEVINNLGNGKYTINDAYEATTNIKKTVKPYNTKFNDLPIPKNLPPEVEKLLTSSRSDLSTAYYVKDKAFDAALKYLDNQKPSDLQKFKEENDSAQRFIISGVRKLLEAKEKVGLEFAPNK
ncbi:hypothetical protein [Paenibacillus piri]|uniref:Uncharacterized protein n=1 Tax=Paenibacillus piri TaxID=2547395 RepID=A0A4R5KZQ0_9BACL|nr:hypothetical protein [Paenibacillus piri]TDG00658.1 hypothetical protein E1757_03250 [Paenibacillus piri]